MTQLEPASKLPADARRSLLVYNLLFPFVLLILLPRIFGRMLRRGGFKTKFSQRLARYSASDRARFASREWIWIQSISVGETFVALKLAHALHQRDPSVGILLSTTTSTGFAEATRAASDWLEPIYNPIDLPWIVRRALATLRPQRLIIIEGGIWPNLVSACRKGGIPISLVNARLSPRSERQFRRFRIWTGPIFRLLDRIAVPEPEDLAGWESLGVDPSRLTCTGSIKFDNPALSGSREQEFRDLLVPLGVERATPILLGGSTWAPEERVLAEVLAKARSETPNLFLILVPRHVERTGEIVRSLEPLGLRVVRRSELQGARGVAADVLLVDTTGELRDWYALATVVFIGKSLPGVRECGGQNPAEAAVLGKAIVFGPHMENFSALVGHLLAHRAVVQVPDAAVLAEETLCLLRDASLRLTLGERARNALAAHAGATERTCAAV